MENLNIALKHLLEARVLLDADSLGTYLFDKLDQIISKVIYLKTPKAD